MKFPPPFRVLVPLSLVAAGLIASALDYHLNLSNDLERHLEDSRKAAAATGSRLAAQAQRHQHNGTFELSEDIATWKDEPTLKFAVVVDGRGMVQGGSSDAWEGRPVGETPLSAAWAIGRARDTPTLEPTEEAGGGGVALSASFPIGADSSRLLAVFDLAESRREANEDARRQLVFSVQVWLFFCLCLWAMIHFTYVARLRRLARQVREFGGDRATVIAPLGGADELHDLSVDFAAMGRQLAQRERERDSLEREVIETVENERRRIGHELHDGIGQHLTAMLMAINGKAAELQTVAPLHAEKLLELSREVSDTINEVRALSHNLSPVPLWEHGLEHALRSLAETTERSSGVRCVFDCPESVPCVYEATAGHLYRIAQEGIGNALKHARAREIRIGLVKRDNSLLLEVEDDGRGLPHTPPGGGGIGLHVMRHRTRMMGARLDVGPAPAGGTRIAVSVPMFP